MQPLNLKRQSRQLALKCLYQTNFQEDGKDNSFFYSYFTDKLKYKKKCITYAELLVKGVNKHKNALDNLIEKQSENWKLERINSIDLIILRIALYEMFFMEKPIPNPIAINEALDIAKDYGTAHSSKFINGILDSIKQPQ